jgi:hypothetical protein
MFAKLKQKTQEEKSMASATAKKALVSFDVGVTVGVH